MIKNTLLALATVAGFALVAGCGSSAVAQSDVEAQISSQLAEQVGQEPDDVVCPGDLDAEVDTEMECTLTAGEDELPVTATVTDVDGDTVNFDIEVGDIK